MCGIFGYVGTKNASPILFNGLKTLEYRGYDSAGIFIPEAGVLKTVGVVDGLLEHIGSNFFGTSGISHTRWATHGVPSKENAHPHGDCSSELFIVHNGIVENYQELRDRLTKKGHTIVSDTDSEVLAHIVEEHFLRTKSLERAVTSALKEVRGTYGIAVLSKSDPNTIVVARMGSPIVLGIGDGEYFVSSDASAVLGYTKQVIYLNDGECATLTPKGYRIFTLRHKKRTRRPTDIDWDIEEVKKGGYEYFMLKEIMEAPDVLADSARGRLVSEKGMARLGGLEDVKGKLKHVKRIVITGCGSAYYAGLVGRSMLEAYTGIPVEAELASELRYRSVVFDKGTAVLAISQSGETADTLAAIRETKRHGLLTLGIVNVVDSTIARETDAGVYNHAGPEIGVASTKAFVSQLEVLALLTLFLGRMHGMSKKDGAELARGIARLPKKMDEVLKEAGRIKRIAKKYSKYNNFLFLGRTYNFPIAFEGALKLKEVSYIHAEGYGAGEMKHGPIAMIDKSFPTVAIVPKDSVYEKMISNIEEVKARDGKVFALASRGDKKIEKLVDDVVYVPKTHEALTPILMTVPLQLFAYYVGVMRGYNVDRPRNLAKSVTVE
jgi:glucosamine--fructose-6-phosphate aminotransferase (isomerizing)|tara:strand:+ start:9242 stop:11062 length:1821 start_codon:yes stop_codon:yes gene_type:complete